MKKAIIAGIGAITVLVSFYGIKTVAADEIQPTVEATMDLQETSKLGKKYAVVSKYTEEIHQINQLRTERLDLRKQVIERKDHLLDLLIAAKENGRKEELEQAKEIKKELKALNNELKALLTERHDERKALKESLKNNESEPFSKLIDTHTQMNEKLTEKLAELDEMIDIFE